MKKGVIRFLNIVYLALSGFALFWYSINFIQPDKVPFLKFGIHAELTAENSTKILTDDTLNSFGVSRDDLFKEGPLVVEANIQIRNQMLLDVWKSDDPAKFIDESFIQPNVDNLVEDIKPAFMTVAKSAAKGALKTTFEDQLKDNLGGDDLYAALAKSNPELTPEKLSEDVGAVIDELLSEDATIDSVSEILTEKYNAYADALNDTQKTTEEMKETIEDTFKELGLVDEDGKINDIENVIAELLGSLLGGDSSGADGGEPAEIALRKLLNPNFEEDNPAEESPIAAKLKQFINDKLTDETKALIVMVFKGCGIALAVFMLGWAIKLLQVIVGFFSKKPYVRKEIIGIIGGIVQFLLAVISAALLFVFQFGGMEKITELIPQAADVLKNIPFIGDGTGSLELTFSAMVPGILCLVNLIYSIIYGIFKRKFKREYKKGNID